MPSYLCGAVSIKLSAADLEDSTSRTLINQHGKEQVDHYQSIEDELKNGLRERPLAEIPLFTDDSHPSRLRFLGTHQDMPFLMVKAGRSLNASNNSSREPIEPTTFLPALAHKKSFSDSIMADDLSSDDRMSVLSTMDEDESPNRELETITCDVEASATQCKSINLVFQSHLTGHEEPLSQPPKSPQISALHSDRTIKQCVPSSQDLKPQALCLTVQLSKKSFLPNPYPHMKKLRALDVKIDIYYNGELCTSCYVAERLRSESTIAELTQRFGGRRVDRLLERPWIIVPSGQNADGTLREHRRGGGGGTGALQRWKAVSHVLKGEAEKGGRNKWGDLSVLGDYLKSLSMLEMPKEVEDLQKGGGIRYGIIDVVLTAGHGKKDNPESGYLSEPARMRTSGLREGGLEAMLEAPKSLPVRRGDRLQATPTATQRAKVFADAEIIRSGFSSLAPRRQVSIPSTVTLQQTGDIVASTPKVFQRDGMFPVPSAPSTAPSAARRRRSGPGQVAWANETPASIPPVADNSPTLQFGNLPRARPSYRGSGPVSNPALRNYSKVRDTSASRSAWTEFFTKAGDRLVSPTYNRAGDNATDLAAATNLKNERNASQQRRQLSQVCVGRTSREPVSTVQDRQKHIAQKRYKGPDSETQEKAQGEQEKEKNKWQVGRAPVVANNFTTTENINTTRDIGSAQQEKKKKQSRMGYINVLTNKLTEAEEIEAIRQVVIDELAARDGETTKVTTIPKLYTTPLTRRSRPSEMPLAPSQLPSASHPVVHRTPQGSDLSPRQPLQRTRSQSHGVPSVRTPLILYLPPNLLSTIGTRFQTPAPCISGEDSASLSPLSSLVGLSPELPDGFPDPGHRRVPKATPKPSRKPLLPAAVSASSSAAQWRPPAMNDDCVITYAPDKVRQVKAERTGWFKEASLLCGVRFLVV